MEQEYQKTWELLKFEITKVFMETEVKRQKEKKKEENNLITKLISLSSILPENKSDVQQAE